MSKDLENIPKADMLMGSMRSMGYSFESDHFPVMVVAKF